MSISDTQISAIASERKFLPRLEALRGFAAVMVAIYHMGIIGPIAIGALQLQDSLAPGGFWFRLYFALMNGFGAVVIFFVLSGFVLARSLDRASTISASTIGKFVVSRLCRLYPAGIVTVALFCVIYFVFGLNVFQASYEPVNILLNAMIIHYDITVVMWSLKVELAAIPVIIVTVIILRNYGPRPVIAILIVLILLSFWKPYYTALGPGSNLAPLHAFVFGILAQFYGASIIARLGSRKVGLIFVCAVVVFCAARQLLGLSPRTILIESCCAAVFVTVVAFSTKPSALACFDWRISRFLGRISYSFYLLHPLMMTIGEFARPQFQQAYAAGIPLVVIVTVTAIFSVFATIPLAYLMWRFVEIPGIALGRWLMGHEARPIGAAAGAET